MEVKPGYKQTEVGVIPEDWDTPPIVDVTRKIMDYRGRTPRKLGMDWGGGDIPALSARNVKMGFIDLAEECYFGSEALYKRWMTKGDTAQNDIVTTMEAPLGNVALIPDDRKYILSQRTILLRVDSALSFSPFLFQLMLSDRFQRLLSENSTGSTAKGIQRKRFETLKVVRPPVLEQRAIADTLADVDALIGALDQLIAKKRDLRQAATQHLLTAKTRLPGFTGQWAVKRLGDVTEIDPDNLASNTAPSYMFNYISLEDVDAGVLRGYSEQVFRTAPSRARRRLRQDDVLISTVRPNLQSHLLFTIAESDWVCSTGFSVVRCNKGVTHPPFLFFLLFGHGVSRQIETLLTGSNYPAINSRDVRALEMPCPSFEEQTAIAVVLSDMAAELAALEARREKTALLKQGMMQELLTGRTRIV